MFLLAFAAVIGGAFTFAVLWPFGIVIAVIGMPFGGSLLAFATGLLLAVLRSRPADAPGKAYLGLPANAPFGYQGDRAAGQGPLE